MTPQCLQKIRMRIPMATEDLTTVAGTLIVPYPEINLHETHPHTIS